MYRFSWYIHVLPCFFSSFSPHPQSYTPSAPSVVIQSATSNAPVHKWPSRWQQTIPWKQKS